MKKVFLSIIALMTIVSFSYAQSDYESQPAFLQGDNLFKLGIGVNSYPLSATPFGASYEIGISNSISIGANVDYLKVTDSGLALTVLYYGIRGSYHVDFDLANTDIYCGAILGYKSLSLGDSGANNTTSIVSGSYIGGFVGATYYLGENLGLFAELGETGVTNARIGISFRF